MILNMEELESTSSSYFPGSRSDTGTGTIPSSTTFSTVVISPAPATFEVSAGFFSSAAALLSAGAAPDSGAAVVAAGAAVVAAGAAVVAAGTAALPQPQRAVPQRAVTSMTAASMFFFIPFPLLFLYSGSLRSRCFFRLLPSR